MEVDVKCKCGHTITMTLYGTNAENESKIRWQEERDCSECYHQSLVAAGKEQEVRVKYFDYKNHDDYRFCKTKADSYDKETRTIVVYMPVKQPTEPKKLSEETIKELAEEYEATAEFIRECATLGSAFMMDELNRALDLKIKSGKFGAEEETDAVEYLKFIIKLKSLGI